MSAVRIIVGNTATNGVDVRSKFVAVRGCRRNAGVEIQGFQGLINESTEARARVATSYWL